MKSRLLIVIALLCFLGALNAQTDRTFASMGYDDAAIIGINGSISYFIKVKPDDNVDQCKIVINVRASQVLNPNNSFVIVYLKDAPVFTQRIVVSPVDSVFSLVVPLSRKYLQPDGRFIKLKIGAKLSISDEYCKDIDNQACWINVRNTSYVSQISQVENSYQRSLKEWIQEFTSVYTPKAADANDLTAGGIIYTLLKQSASSTNKEIFTSQYSPNDSLPGGIIVGVKDKLPPSILQALPQNLAAGQGLIALVGVPVGMYTKYVLVVTGGNEEGYKKAIYTLASNRRLSSAFTDKLIISEAVPSNFAIESPSPLVTSLDDLGGTPSLMEGIGSLRSKYTFSLTEFNAIPTKLLFHLESYFSTLKADDRGFVNIYLNQNLIYNASLLDKSSFINDIDLKPYLLTKFNTLEVEFRFHPGANICKDGFSNFFAFVNTKSSTLTFSGERENRFYSFFNFPAEFRKTETKIIVSPSLMKNDIISSIGEIYYQLNSPIKNDFNKLIVPPIITTDKATNFSDLNSFNLIVLLDRNDAFVKNFSNMPVRYDKDFQIYSDADKKTTYSINDFSNSGLAQIFREKGSTILLVTSLGDSSLKNSFVSVIKNFSTQLTEIESNVCIANSNGLSNYFFKMPEDNNMVSYKSDKSWLTSFWDNFKFVILAILLILVVLAYFFVRSKVKQSQEIV